MKICLAVLFLAILYVLTGLDYLPGLMVYGSIAVLAYWGVRRLIRRHYGLPSQ